MRRSVVRIALLVAVLLGSVSTVGRPGGVAAQKDQAQLDLATIPVTPEEAEAIGLEGYGLSFGQVLNQYESTRDIAPYLGVDPEDFERAMVEEAGLTRNYVVRLARPIERGNPGTAASRYFFTDIYEFASAEGAVAGERYLVEVGVPDGAEPVVGNRTIGDSSRIVRFSKTEEAPGHAHVDVMYLSFRTGTLYIELSLWDPIHKGEAPEPPTVAELEALASRTMIRVGAARAGDLPDIGTRMVRLGIYGECAGYSADRYDVQYGRVMVRYGSSTEADADNQARVEQGGVIHAYRVDQSICNPYDLTVPGMSMTVRHLVGEREAADWLKTSSERASTWRYYTAFAPLDEAVELGDEAAAFAVTVDFGGDPLPGHVLYTRIGTDVVEVLVYAPGGASLETAFTLAKIQLACLTGKACPVRVPIPDDLKAK